MSLFPEVVRERNDIISTASDAKLSDAINLSLYVTRGRAFT